MSVPREPAIVPPGVRKSFGEIVRVRAQTQFGDVLIAGSQATESRRMK
jgi:hypothetical protein